MKTVTINSQMDLGIGNDIFTYSPTIGSSISTGTVTVDSNWDSAVYTGVSPAHGSSGTITIGSQTLTEDKLKVLNDMQDWQEEVNKKLAILQPNPELENQWSELKELRERYVKLEKELTEKTKMWDILKDAQKGSS